VRRVAPDQILRAVFVQKSATSAFATGMYVTGVVSTNKVPIRIHDHQSLSVDMALAPFWA
jgi:hypothetical protein